MSVNLHTFVRNSINELAVDYISAYEGFFTNNPKLTLGDITDPMEVDEVEVLVYTLLSSIVLEKGSDNVYIRNPEAYIKANYDAMVQSIPDQKVRLECEEITELSKHLLHDLYIEDEFDLRNVYESHLCELHLRDVVHWLKPFYIKVSQEDLQRYQV